MSDSYAVLPQNMGKEPVGGKDPRLDPHKYVPEKRGGLVLKDPKEEQCPYSFKDSPAYVAKKKYDERVSRAVELESKEDTRGFLRSVEELGKKHKWEEAFQILERRTAVPSGLFLVTRAVLRWKFANYHGALADADEALKNYGSSAKAGPLAAAFSCFVRICLGSHVPDQGSCSKQMQPLVADWEASEQLNLQRSALGQGLFHPKMAERLDEPTEVLEGYEAHDGTYLAAPGVRIGYMLLKNVRDLVSAPVVVHFHGSNEVAADYRTAVLAEKYRVLGVHLLVVDYRGYGWGTEETPSLATFLRDAEPFAEKLPELFVQHGFSWPYTGGLILSGRSLGAQVAVHLATLFPLLFRYLMLDSAMATSATGDRLGRASERTAALECWCKELEKASLEVLQPLSADLCVISVHEKIRAFDGELLVLHGLADETVPFEGSESLHAAAGSRQKELVLVENADHNNIDHYDVYWSAVKRFCLKVQLNDAVVPCIGKVQHLCAVCAEKAVSKCGRCQKVWYCGRKHQAEHWKGHKLTCAGGPPEPTVKVEEEADACLVAVVVASLHTSADASGLHACLLSLSAQTESLQGIYLSWHAEAQTVAEEVTSSLESFPSVLSLRASKPLTRFEHISALSGHLGRAPAHSWVVFLEPYELWNPKCASLLLPALRRAAADARNIAASCGHRATSIAGVRAPSSATEVETALEDGNAELAVSNPASDPKLVDFVVKVKALLTFLEATPAGMLSHELCTYSFLYKMSHTFGKKVQAITLSDSKTAWLRWVPASSSTQVRPIDADRRLGEEVYKNLKSMERFSDAEATTLLMVGLREGVLRRMAQWAGETVAADDIKAMVMDQTTSFLEKHELSEVFGFQRWIRDMASTIAEAAREEFSVKLLRV